jgi:hypothetical protein
MQVVADQGLTASSMRDSESLVLPLHQSPMTRPKGSTRFIDDCRNRRSDTLSARPLATDLTLTGVVTPAREQSYPVFPPSTSRFLGSRLGGSRPGHGHRGPGVLEGLSTSDGQLAPETERERPWPGLPRARYQKGKFAISAVQHRVESEFSLAKVVRRDGCRWGAICCEDKSRLSRPIGLPALPPSGLRVRAVG